MIPPSQQLTSTKTPMVRMQCPSCQAWLQYKPSTQPVKGLCLYCGNAVQNVIHHSKRPLAPIPAFGPALALPKQATNSPKPLETRGFSQNGASEKVITLHETSMNFVPKQIKPTNFEKNSFKRILRPNENRPTSHPENKKSELPTGRKKVSRVPFVVSLFGILLILAGGMLLLTRYQSEQTKGFNQLVSLVKKVVSK